MEIRRATDDDADAIASLLREAFAEYEPRYTRDAFAATVLNRNGVLHRIAEGPVWCAVNDGRVVGTVAIVEKWDGFYLRGMAVSPAFRGRGAGKRLLREVEAFAATTPHDRLFLSTTPFLLHAIRLYAQNGFRRVATGPHELFGTPLFTMEKRLLTVGEPVDTTPARAPLPVVLDGSFVTLTPLDPDAHGDDLYEFSSGEGRDVWLYLSHGPFSSRQEFDGYLRQDCLGRDGARFLAIVDKQLRKATGFAAYLAIATNDRTIEVGHVLFTHALQRTPGATEAMYLMARHAFEDLGYRRYEWKCDSLNHASRTAALRLGFTFEGTFRQHMIRKGRNRDTDWFSITDREWPERKRAFERWLSPSNFDANGAQKRRLAECQSCFA